MIPHTEQKYNTNQLSLHYTGNLAYHQGKTSTSDSSVNSLTTYTNHYTLLYPDLVQELFNFSLHNNNNVKNNSLFFGVLGVNNTKYSSLDSSLSSSLDSLLSPRDILFFLQIVSLYQLELSKGNTSITYPSLKLAKLLGVDASCDTDHIISNTPNNLSSTSSNNSLSTSNMRATILKMTAKLESLGLLKVFRRKRKNGMDMANKLVPVLPDRLHAKIKDLPFNLKVSDSSKLDHESNLEHILRTKLFVPIELEFMKSLFKDSMPSKYKIFFLNCIMSAYRNFRNNISGSDILSFSATSSELIKKNNISRSTLDRIFRYVKQQGDSFFLKVEHKYTKSDDLDCNRYDKSIFVISINPLVFPISKIRKSQTEEIANFDCYKLQSDVLPILPDNYERFKTAWSKKQPSIVKKTALNNKEEMIKNKDIDYIDVNHLNFKNSSVENSQDELRELPTTKKTAINYKEEFFEDKQGLSSSGFYNNSSFFDKAALGKAPEQKHKKEKKKELEKPYLTPDKEQLQELRHFYPIAEKDISLLNSRANREFSTNFVNQLLLKLYIKYPEKRFKNRFTFLSYMAQILANEKHQGPLVNHRSFRFSCNIGTEEKSLLEYERYLNQIEDSLDTSKEMCVKKKIAGRFSTDVAYKILTKVQFRTNQDNSFITALVPNYLTLRERQIATLSEQLEAVYGVNGYYVQEVEEETPPPKEITSSITSEDKSIGISEQSKELDTTKENTVWHQIRQGLREELGYHIDQAWFAKAEAVGCKETKTLTLTMPTRFMADWVRNNYSHVIRRVAVGEGVEHVEYGYGRDCRESLYL